MPVHIPFLTFVFVIDVLTATIKWLNTNAGAVQAVCTLALVGVTGWYAFHTRRISRFSSAAAGEAARSVAAQEQALQAELFFKLFAEYASTDMDDSLKELRRWLDANRDNVDVALSGWVQARDDPSRAGEPARRLDTARRRVMSFYQKVAVLADNKFLQPNLRQQLQGLAGHELLQEAVRPLDRALAEKLGTLDQHKQFFGDVDTIKETGQTALLAETAAILALSGRDVRLFNQIRSDPRLREARINVTRAYDKGAVVGVLAICLRDNHKLSVEKRKPITPREIVDALLEASARHDNEVAALRGFNPPSGPPPAASNH